MQLRNAAPADLDEIVAIEFENFAENERIPAEVLASYVHQHSASCLVVEDQGQIVATLMAVPIVTNTITDDLFFEIASSTEQAQTLAIASLSVLAPYQQQGLGTLLLATLKEIAVANGFEGIALTCHEELIFYYEQNGFEDIGVSESQLGGQIWYDMYWKCPE